MYDSDRNIKKEKSILIELIRVTWKHRRPFYVLNLSILLAALVYAFAAPVWYRSEAKFLVTYNVETLPLTSILFEMPVNILGNEDLMPWKYIAMLYSRNLLDKMIAEFDLEKAYNQRSREKLYEKIYDNLIFRDNMDGTISILSYFKEDPVKAAALANRAFQLLLEMDEKLNRQQATAYRTYMDENYREALDLLSKAEERMRDFKNEFGVIDLEMQVRDLIELISSLESEKIVYEIERDYLEGIAEDNYPELLSLNMKVKVVDEKLQTLQGDPYYKALSAGEMPDLDLQYIRNLREVGTREKVVEFLVTQVEQAKLDERKITTNLLLIDEGVPGERHSRPRRLQIITLSIFFGFFLSLFFVVLLEFYDRHRDELKKIFTEDQQY